MDVHFFGGSVEGCPYGTIIPDKIPYPGMWYYKGFTYKSLLYGCFRDETPRVWRAR